MPTSNYAACYDSDGGKDFLTTGYVTYNGYTNNGEMIKEYDSCDGDYLYEKYCSVDENNQEGIGLYGYACPNGCEDGACIGGEDTTVKET